MNLSEPLFRAAPLLAAPLPPEGLPGLAPGCKRFVAAADGLHVQARTPALSVSLPLAHLPLPYGPAPRPEVTPNPLSSPPLRAALRDFLDAARAQRDEEIAGAILESPSGPALRLLPVLSSSATHVSYDDHDIDDDALLVDVHSHGRLPAFFSTFDNRSDLSRRGPYVAIVVGGVEAASTTTLVARLVLPPYLVPFGPAWVNALTAELLR